jgi:hypothetical protein
VCGNVLLRRPEPFWAVDIAEDDVILITVCTVIRICHFPKWLWPEPNWALACSRHGTRPYNVFIILSEVLAKDMYSIGFGKYLNIIYSSLYIRMHQE